METSKKRKNRKNEKWRDLSTASLFFFATSFIGWLFETAVCFIMDKKWSDRGFLTLPFCPVYGLPITLCYLLIGTPKEGVIQRFFDKIKVKTKKRKVLRFLGCCAAYSLLASAFATIFELFAAILLKNANAVMWDYSAFPLHYKGYVCFSISFIWGVLLTISAATFLHPLFLLLARLNKRAKAILNVLLWTLLVGDVLFSFYYLKTNAKRYEWMGALMRILQI